MYARSFNGVALASVLSTLFAPAAFAGGWGHGGGGHGGAVFHTGGGVHGGFGGRGGWGGSRPDAQRGMPPIAGVIHERSGMRPYVSSYGHTATAVRFGRVGVPAYGHVGTALRYGADRGVGAFGYGRRRFAGRGGFVGGGDGGYGGGTYGAAGIYGDAGVYGGQGTSGRPGTYGGYGTTATQGTYASGFGVAYRSETPLAARFAEAPLGPSPYTPYSPGDRYAYAASEDVRPMPRVTGRDRSARPDCACEARTQPTFYRYGIGTAY